MELRRYWTILRRYWLLALIPAALVLALGLATWRPAPTVYNAGVRFLVGQPPGAAAADFDEQRYYNWLASEYVVNGLTDWIRGGRFAAAVSQRLAAQGIDAPPGLIQGGLAVDNARSMLTVSLTMADHTLLQQVLLGVVAVLTEENAAALPQLGGERAILTQLDEPVVNAIAPGIRGQLDLPLRVGLALLAGLGLALLAHYLDPTVRDRTELERVGLPILGAIPRERSTGSRFQVPGSREERSSPGP
jgi:capsular polysaccharide biosynthesis protein